MALAGVTQVRFIEPTRFTDTHLSGEPVGNVLLELERLLVDLGQQCLPPGQRLDIDVLDVDLAGTGRYLAARQAEVRLISSGVDAPRITLRYTLTENGQHIAGQEEVLRDLSFLEHRRFGTPTESYPYEKRLLRDWFTQRFGNTCTKVQAAARP